ncbi:ferredoxin [Patescibacteria group bacterium]|nr:ferredoxin [Patescibacteria group bacterium]
MSKKYRIVVNEDQCLGCGTCAALQPKYFKMEGQKSRPVKEVVVEGEDDIDAINEAISMCPSEGILLESLEE